MAQHAPSTEQGTHNLSVPIGRDHLEGDLVLPVGAHGLVLFAHGSGSSRWSSRNRFVAGALREHGVATLLFDLLTEGEEAADAVEGRLRFNIPLLARRLGQVTDWVSRQAPVAALPLGYFGASTGAAAALPLGYFGASTGAAAALLAAAERPDLVRAVVSRGGRPDLAGAALARVHAPTLLIVGGADHGVIELNRDALARLAGPKHLAIVPGATHLFEEPGALRQVAALAGAWFERYLVATAAPELRPA